MLKMGKITGSWKDAEFSSFYLVTAKQPSLEQTKNILNYPKNVLKIAIKPEKNLQFYYILELGLRDLSR